MIEMTLSAADVAILYRLTVEQIQAIYNKAEIPLGVNLSWFAALNKLKNTLEQYLKKFQKEIEDLQNE